MICDRILDDMKKSCWSLIGSDSELVKKLHHQTSESFERSWDSSLWIDFDENVLLRSDVNLQQSSAIQRRVHQHEEWLMCDVRTTSAWISVVFPENLHMVIAIEQLECVADLKWIYNSDRRVVMVDEIWTFIPDSWSQKKLLTLIVSSEAPWRITINLRLFASTWIAFVCFGGRSYSPSTVGFSYTRLRLFPPFLFIFLFNVYKILNARAVYGSQLENCVLDIQTN